MEDDIKHLQKHKNQIKTPEVFSGIIHAGGDAVIKKEVEDKTQYFDEYLDNFYLYQKKCEDDIKSDFLKIKKSIHEQLDVFLGAEQDKLIKELHKKNARLEEQIKIGQESMKFAKEKIADFDLENPSELFASLCSLVSDPEKFTFASKSYLKKCSYIEKILKEDKKYCHFQKIQKDYDNIEQVFTFYDSTEKYDKPKILTDIDMHLKKLTDTISTLVSKRNNFAPSPQKIPKAPSENPDDDVEQVQQSFVEQQERHTLVLSSLAELKLCDRHKVENINELKILLQQ